MDANMAFYDRLKSTASRLIGSRGKPATLIRQTQTGPAYNPTKAENSYPIKLVETGYSISNRNDSLVQTGDKLGLISAAGEAPQFGDKLVIDGSRYNIVDLQPLAPGETTLLFEFVARI